MRSVVDLSTGVVSHTSVVSNAMDLTRTRFFYQLTLAVTTSTTYIASKKNLHDDNYLENTITIDSQTIHKSYKVWQWLKTDRQTLIMHLLVRIMGGTPDNGCFQAALTMVRRLI